MFDSGIGGLTVLKEVRSLLPAEHIVYLGDTARVPYGSKSPHTVTKYALESALFLLTKGIKVLVIACNTSAALSLSILKKKLPIPVLGVIDPGAKEAVAHTKNKKIGVIGTKATIRSMAYERAIKRLDPGIDVISRSCPLFVPIAEEGLMAGGRDLLAMGGGAGHLPGLGTGWPLEGGHGERRPAAECRGYLRNRAGGLTQTALSVRAIGFRTRGSE